MPGDDAVRAELAVNIGLFFATIILGFLIYIIVEPAASQMLDIAGEHTTRESSTQGQNYVAYALGSAHLLVVGFGALQLIVAAVYEGRVAP